jgi:D-beta-D-heptose 7-phosphate kinase/D-beta-D-heptose 1-phosphate adenosyltransferase
MNKQPKILLIGDHIVDEYIFAEAVKMSDEAPVVVLREQKRETRPGGAANVRENLLKLGASVNTWFGDKVPSRKVRIVANNQQVVRVDQDNFESSEAPDDLVTLIEECDLVAIADYNKGVVTKELTNEVDKLAKQFKKPVIVDPYKKRRNYGQNITLIKPNKAEAESVTGISIEGPKSLIKAGQIYMDMSEAENLVITLGAEGMALFDRHTYWDKPFTYIPKTVNLVDITGAGDTVFAVLAFIWAHEHFSKSTSVRYATKAGRIAVEHFGTYAVSHDEVFQSDLCENRPIVSTVGEVLEKSLAKKIVLANGCFDIIHGGHIHLLEEASKLGDVLVVGLNTDESVRELKGRKRPYISQEHRAKAISGIKGVDYVVFFDKLEDLLVTLSPDVIVKGEDWKGKETVEKKYLKIHGGVMVYVDFKEDLSSTKIAESISAGGVCLSPK